MKRIRRKVKISLVTEPSNKPRHEDALFIEVDKFDLDSVQDAVGSLVATLLETGVVSN